MAITELRQSLTPEERLQRVAENSARFRCARLQPNHDSAGPIAICGYGPSLADTWRDAARSDVVMTTSGAHDFLLARGVVPRYHVECDPRAHKVEFVRRSHPDVTYLINSQCHPLMFEALAGRKLVMWHGFSDDDAENQIRLLESLEPGARLLAGGTNVGMRALPVARELGHTEFDLHGLDCCYRGADQWAGPHAGVRHRTVHVRVNGKVFETSDLMMVSTDDFFKLLNQLPGCRFRVHGGGLLEERLKIYLRDPQTALTPAWWEPVDFVVRELPFSLMLARQHPAHYTPVAE